MLTLNAKRGDTLRARFVFTESGSAANLSGCSARMQIRAKGTLTLILSASTDAGDLTIDGSSGFVTAEIPASVMRDVATGKYQADIELTYADGSVRSSDTFAVIVAQDMTYTE